MDLFRGGDMSILLSAGIDESPISSKSGAMTLNFSANLLSVRHHE
jgi:hypothetical protein